MFLVFAGCSGFGLVPSEDPVLAARVADAGEDTGGDLAEAGTEESEIGEGVEVKDSGTPGDTAAELEPPPDPSAAGPYAVGVRTVEPWDGDRWRSLPTEVWYPVDAAAPSGSPNTYAIEFFGQTLYEVATPALRDAAPLPGTWPVVMFSHGYGGIRFQSYFLAEHLASHGFLVVAPDHPGNTLTEVWNLGSDEAASQSSVDRPLDMSFALDALLGGELGVSADASRIGISGHSFGGWTAVQTPLGDRRFVASLPMAPGFKETATPGMSADLGIPFLVIGGSADATCEFEENQRPTYEAAERPKILVSVQGAGHLDFSNLCEIELAKMFVDDGCDAASIDPAVVQARSKTLATAFAKTYVEGDDRYAPYLDEDAIESLGNVEAWTDR
jgi:predicted dienelactone hydrolase